MINTTFDEINKTCHNMQICSLCSTGTDATDKNGLCPDCLIDQDLGRHEDDKNKEQLLNGPTH